MAEQVYRIGVVSDTHGLVRDEVREVLKTCQVILHGGDINRREILEELKAIAPLFVVRGPQLPGLSQSLPCSHFSSYRCECPKTTTSASPKSSGTCFRL